jgi:uncharacterized protein
MEFFLAVIGTVLVIEGIPWFFSPRGMKKMYLSIFALPDSQLRTFGLISMIAGLLVVYVATR